MRSKNKILNQMIDDQLLVQQTRVMNIHVSPQDIDEAVKKARHQFKTEGAFNQELSKPGGKA